MPFPIWLLVCLASLVNVHHYLYCYNLNWLSVIGQISILIIYSWIWRILTNFPFRKLEVSKTKYLIFPSKLNFAVFPVSLVSALYLRVYQSKNEAYFLTFLSHTPICGWANLSGVLRMHPEFGFSLSPPVPPPWTSCHLLPELLQQLIN
jgi:hypothetical protein